MALLRAEVGRLSDFEVIKSCDFLTKTCGFHLFSLFPAVSHWTSSNYLRQLQFNFDKEISEISDNHINQTNHDINGHSGTQCLSNLGFFSRTNVLFRSTISILFFCNNWIIMISWG